MLKSQVPTEDDVKMAMSLLRASWYILNLYVLANLLLYMVFDGYYGYHITILIFIVGLLSWCLAFILPNSVSKWVSKWVYNVIHYCLSAQNIIANQCVFFILSASKRINFIKKKLIRPFVFLPLVCLNLFILLHGVALFKDWLVYIDPVAVTDATSKSLFYNNLLNYRSDLPFCLMRKEARKNAPLEKSSYAVCDMREITYKGKTQTRKMFYYIEDTGFYVNANLVNSIYASRLFPSNMTSGIVITKYSMTWRMIKLFTFMALFTLILYIFIFPNWFKSRYLD